MPIFSFTLEELYKITLRLFPDEVFQFTLTPLGIRDPMELSANWIQREFDRRRREIETRSGHDIWAVRTDAQRKIDNRLEWRTTEYQDLHEWRAKYMDRINGKWEEGENGRDNKK